MNPAPPPAYAPIFSAAGLRRIEAAAQGLDPHPTLMERAGLAAAETARRLLGDRGRNVLVLAGPGNNGGDAFEAAARLRSWFYRVSVVFAGKAESLPADAGRARQKWLAGGGKTTTGIPDDEHWDLIVDGLFGIGLARPLEGRFAELVSHCNGLSVARRIPLLALDIPSGINSDTGVAPGAAIKATHTITFIALKPGLLTLDGPDHCGALECADLGVDTAAPQFAEGALLSAAVLQAMQPRPRNFHKGHAGNVIVGGGASGMAGAVIIAARAALKSGAGKVFVAALAKQAPTLDLLQPELMFRTPRAALREEGVALIGPGLSRDKAALSLLKSALGSARTLVLDADALNLIGEHAALRPLLAKRAAPTLMTPHPAEAARLLQASTAAVQQDRVAAACKLADRYRSLVVLKGNGSIVARPENKKTASDQSGGPRWWINPSGNPGMASAGMGDALGGMLASYLAQGVAPLPALQLAVWLHGAAADELCGRGTGPCGITASEVIDQARLILNRPRSQA